jgi:hypothetical protein
MKEHFRKCYEAERALSNNLALMFVELQEHTDKNVRDIATKAVEDFTKHNSAALVWHLENVDNRGCAIHLPNGLICGQYMRHGIPAGLTCGCVMR